MTAHVLDQLGFAGDQFRLDYAGMLAACRQDAWLPGRHGWVVAPTTCLGNPVIDLDSGLCLAPSAVSHLANPLWERSGYAVLRYVRSRASIDEPELLSRFRHALVNEQTRILRVASEWCAGFLASRTSGTQPLSRLPTVAQAQASTFAEVHLLRHLDINHCLDSAGGRRLLSEHVESACEHLIKLAGGRALLSGQMVHVTTLFTTLNRLYLEDPT